MPTLIELASSAIRGCIVAAPGKKLVAADLSNIEGRVLAWLAGENWKLQAFRDYDAGTGPDLYVLAYARAFNIAPEAVGKPERQIGKVFELALGYQGGVGAFLTFAAVYGLDIDALAEAAWPIVPAVIRSEAQSALDWTRQQKRPTFGLTDKAWMTCEALKRLWRNAHPATVALWRDLESAARNAASAPGTPQTVRGLKLQRDGGWLRIRLPSGRCLCYPAPQIDATGKLTYMGINQYSRTWSRLHTYGGKLVENITQAVARDVLARAMPAIEDAGYPIVLTVHDEIVCETPDTPDYTPEKLAALMCAAPAWAQGLPLSAAGFEAYRYRKD